ncbi:adenosylmethionine--8-amino-7-oxononanoate transaminase [Solemya pervernicosa gill symbiont]|uniref:Adenosylmethionine-8-amino-7-oxononanoate aminotransferase n=2 Tax=Gammaproteobacteria incertae sedis TaxID=118884 RepID=A0A1T2LAV1_9GAMM|nr:adenosylmethionine--8-amino-7-oxononanoate transaminase [Solemya pervernicosa gill symbiont]QKQ28261.1 adenosylmethionine--8-amino-7-oxononanoate transaminase [Candidatus Reidiella endopervernicosa]
MSNTDHADWLSFDAEHIWHPYNTVIDPLPNLPVVAAEGVYLQLEDGRRLIDGMSSWWSAIHGYNVPQLNQAIIEQSQKMAHVMFGGITHPSAVELARRLIDLTAEPLHHVFFADSGSVSVEVAIKMAIQYWITTGKGRKRRLLTVRNGYHGDTFGAMAVTDPDNSMHSLFKEIVAEHLFAPAPNCQNDQADITAFERLISNHHDELAAVILEPIVQGAGGMRFYCPDYLRQVRSLCDRHDVLLILDEIATGFGRTGTLFAYEQADIVPDILCIGKALTGGYMTLAATLTTNRVAYGVSADGQGVLMHGPTFMANPLACSVATASIDLLLDSPWQSRVAAIEKQLQSELAPCEQSELVKKVRCLGAIGVVELTQPVDMAWLQPRLVEEGVWIRPFGRLIYLMPPYIIEPEQLSQLTSAVVTVICEMDAQ